MSPAPHPVDADCIFCKIIAGSIPSARVYEDAHVIAFLDISPIAKGHTLVVPRGHYPTLLDLPDHTAQPLMRVLRLVAGAVKEATGASGFNCVQNNFASAGQVVFHSHWHVIPRFDADGFTDWPGGSYSDPAEMQQFALSINSRIPGWPAGGTHE